MIVELSRRRPRVRVPSTPPLSGAEAGAYKSLLLFVQAAQSDNVNAGGGVSAGRVAIPTGDVAFNPATASAAA